MGTKRLGNNLPRDLFVLEDETNPRGSKLHGILPSTILDQVYDDRSPTQKNLRQIIEDLKQEIITGGRGNIIFPVTSVNGQIGDIVLEPVDLGLGRVDNTRDADKPLSEPQRKSIMNILAEYDFNVNLDQLYRHLSDGGNPHNVTLDQINKNNDVEQFVNRYIDKHNYSTNTSVHMDIRRSLSTLWMLVDDINNNLEDRVGKVLDSLSDHLSDLSAHIDLFDKKEDKQNKVGFFSKSTSSDHTKYPTTRAVVEYVASQFIDFRGTLPDLQDWIDDIVVVDSRGKLPQANDKSYRKAYFIRNGNGSHDEVAICRLNPDTRTYSWDISTMGTYSKFDNRYFVDTPDGMSIKMSSVIDAIISENGMLDTTLSEILSNYYTKQEIDNFRYVKNIRIIPGTQNGTIRYYINNDQTTMSEDVKVSGLQRLAYLEYITEEELFDQAVHSRHIISRAIEKRHLNDRIIDPTKMTCKYGHVLGNTNNSGNDHAHEITLMELADYLRPLIGGWPDPNTPGGNPWQEIIDTRISHPHLLDPGKEQNLNDGSYVIRFVGEVSCIPNMNHKIIITDKLNISNAKMFEVGGSWCYQSDPESWTILGGSNITGHTFATINMDNTGLYFESISIGDRMNAQYDVWIKYIKK